MIVLNQIKKVFNTNSGCVTAVDSVNLSIRKGEIFGIIGYSGAGKKYTNSNVKLTGTSN